MDISAPPGLGPEYANWLESLARLGPPPGGLFVPLDAPALLEQLRFEPEDRPATLAALQSVSSSPEWRWLLECAVNAVHTDISDIEGMRPMPNLPADLGAVARCFWIVVFLCATPAIREWHRAHAVSDQMSWDSLADLGRHVRLYRERNATTGLDTQRWISLTFRGGLFAIGRLQYAPYHLQTGPAGPLFWYDVESANRRGPAFARGAPVLGVHIPEAGPLTPSACRDSFQAARTFFNEHFPEYVNAIATCTSWLLDDQLQHYLEPDSNIIAFQRRFELVPGWRESDSSAFHFVFGHTPTNIDDLTPRTTLERAIVQHVRSGAHWGLRTGWLRLAEQS